MNKVVKEHNSLNMNNGRKASKDTFLPVFSRTVDGTLRVVVLALILLFILFPMVCIALRSFAGPEGLTLGNYVEVFTKYRQNFVNSVVVGVATAILCTFFSVCTALFIYTKTGKLRLALMAVLLVSMVAPPFVSSLAYIQLYGRRGWIT